MHPPLPIKNGEQLQICWRGSENFDFGGGLCYGEVSVMGDQFFQGRGQRISGVKRKLHNQSIKNNYSNLL